MSIRTKARGFTTALLLILLLFYVQTVWSAGANNVEIIGLSDPLLANAQAHLTNIDLGCNAPRWQAETTLTQAHRAVRTALEAMGYYQPTIASTLERVGACWQIHLDVKPGTPIQITAISLILAGSGKQDKGLQALIADSGLHIGQVLNQGDYTALKQRLEGYTHEHGYFDARFTEHRILVDPATHSAQIRLSLNTGSRYVFGQTMLDIHSLNPSLVKGFLAYHPGEPYNANAVIESQSALVASGYFDSVRLQTQSRERAHGEVPMRLSTTPARRYQLLAGAGYSTDTGPALRLDFRNHRVNRAGHRYALNLQLARIQSQATARYEIPLANPRTDWLTLETGYQYQNTLAAQTRTWKFGATRTHLLADNWLRRISLEYLNENSTVAGTTLSGHFLIPGIGYSRTLADAPIYPQRGWSIDARLRGAARSVISTESFVQARLDIHAIAPLFGGRILTRAALGATAVDNVSSLPATLRFFAGGARSVRGYAYQSLGPTDAQGVIVGGRYLAVGSLEYDHHLTGQFYWATFYDVGNAFDTWPFTLRRGVGIGLRWHSPLGPIRLDLATPLNPLPGASRFVIQVSMGPEL
ncbi:hypothetical protein BI364_11725 [Acidihalobacter yilgarnensis]|uniref:Translocation and assembly module subunit TamA n=1 Tax=Acidihalobacter yilgarnensis TaxID=2819280 RepID=A0A1D8IQ25_9GAMM|nr:autotransporter assembly complex family protein [Acidihalobacter yilgarnensis]AOU98536.1 hypothetical protein BI364_11725 [Acidihalobacter yilgarnensis]